MLISFAIVAVAADLYVGTAHPYATLDQAVDDASPSDRILLEPGTWFVSGALAKDLSIVGIGGAAVTTVRGTHTDGVIRLSGVVSLSLRDLTLDGELTRRGLFGTAGSTVRVERCAVVNGAGDDGGAMRLQGTSTLEATVVENSSSPTDAGCLEVTGQSFIARGLHLERCTALQDGGAIRLGTDLGAPVLIEGARFGSGTAGRGGAVFVRTAESAVVLGSSFVGNEATTGGAVYVSDEGALILDRSQVRANSATGNGGGAFADDPLLLEVSRSSWLGNEAGGIGGGLHSGSSPDFSVTDSWFEGNHADAYGGALCANGGPTEIRRSVLCGNSSPSDGGAIDTGANDTLVSHSIFIGNSGGSGGAIWGARSDAGFFNLLLLDNAAGSAGAVQLGNGSGIGLVPFERNVVLGSIGSSDAVGPANRTEPDQNWYFDNASDHAADYAANDTVDIDPLITRTGCSVEVAESSPLWDAGIGPFAGVEGDLVLANVSDVDGDGFAAMIDCDDASPEVYFDAPEACDGVDSDCDGLPDALDPDAFDQIWFADLDSDGLGRAGTGRLACGGAGLAAAATDCDDGDPAIGAGGFFLDLDGDGFGDPARPSGACTASAGVVANPLDCDDSDPAVHPDAVEICNSVDDDCDGLADDADTDVDPGLQQLFYPDGDQDGFGTALGVRACSNPGGYATVGGDCDDAEPSVHPGAAELCDGFDNDCDPLTIDSDVEVPWYLDLDGDGFGSGTATLDCGPPEPTGWSLRSGDCDDGDVGVNPDQLELCNGLDEDCDGVTDEDPLDGVVGYVDLDGDGYGTDGSLQVACSGLVADGSDCDDTNVAVSPGAVETCNGIDDDCDGLSDDADVDVQGQSIFAPDLDADTFGYGGLIAACSAPDGYAVPGDCDDSEPGVNPAALDIPEDGIDQDCDGVDAVAVDSDGDGLYDHVEVAIGSNPDASDSDGDGVPDGVEFGDGTAPRDSDGDGAFDLVDEDDDGDGIPTAVETDGDADGDGVPNHLDLDSDNDGLPDEVEARIDTDGDGIPEFLDPADTAKPDIRGGCGCRTGGVGVGWLWVALVAIRRGRGYT